MTESIESVYVGNSKYIPVRELSAAQLSRYKEPYHWRTHEDVPCGRFGLLVYVRGLRVSWVKRWQEAKSGDFASMVAGFIAELEAAVPSLVVKHQEAMRKAEEEHRRWEEERRRAEEQAERARQTKNRQDARNDLLTAIAAWEQARSVHAYLRAVESEIEQLPPDGRDHLRGRLAEARVLIGDVDALAKLRQWKALLER